MKLSKEFYKKEDVNEANKDFRNQFKISESGKYFEIETIDRSNEIVAKRLEYEFANYLFQLIK